MGPLPWSTGGSLNPERGFLRQIEGSLPYVQLLGWPQKWETYGDKRGESHRLRGLLTAFLWWSCVGSEGTGAEQGPGNTISCQKTHIMRL